jgi:hypothetical protein
MDPIWNIRRRAAALLRTLIPPFFALLIGSCTLASIQAANDQELLRVSAVTIQEIKSFERDLGIEPTEALSQTAQQRHPLSLLWIWLQRTGTIAMRSPVDVRLTIGFNDATEKIPLERIYQVKGYSVYYRQGNEFADGRSVVTPGFAQEAAVRRVMVVIHEDLHGDQNFDLPWELEESLVTPLGSLAAVEFFKYKGDEANLRIAQAQLAEERALSREVNQVARSAEQTLRDFPQAMARRQILAAISSSSVYGRYFERQIVGQHPETVIEAKLSHDLAYYKQFDRIVGLYDVTGDLKTLLQKLRNAPRPATFETLDSFLESLEHDTIAAQ